MGRRRVFLSLGADSRQDYVTACELFTARRGDGLQKRNEYFTKSRVFSYKNTAQAGGILPFTGYQ
jgi:hypothetical protein